MGFSFVNNTDLVAALAPNTPGEQILDDFQQSLNKWENDWWVHCSLDDMSGNVTMKDKHRVSLLLYRLDTDAAKKTMGVLGHLSPLWMLATWQHAHSHDIHVPPTTAGLLLL